MVPPQGIYSLIREVKDGTTKDTKSTKKSFSIVLFVTFVVPIEDPQHAIPTRQRQSVRARERGDSIWKNSLMSTLNVYLRSPH